MRRKIQKHIDNMFREFLEEVEDRFSVDIEEDEAVFPVEVVCKLADLQYWTLRSILKEGIVKPKKIGKKKILFSKKDIKKVECVKYLMDERGVNLQGVRVFFEISDSR